MTRFGKSCVGLAYNIIMEHCGLQMVQHELYCRATSILKLDAKTGDELSQADMPLAAGHVVVSPQYVVALTPDGHLMVQAVGEAFCM